MGLGAGHMMDMNNRMKQNREHSKSKRPHKDGSFIDDQYKKPIVFKEIDEQTKNTVREEIKSNNVKQKAKERLIFLLILAMLLLAFSYFFLKIN